MTLRLVTSTNLLKLLTSHPDQRKSLSHFRLEHFELKRTDKLELSDLKTVFYGWMLRNSDTPVPSTQFPSVKSGLYTFRYKCGGVVVGLTSQI